MRRAQSCAQHARTARQPKYSNTRMQYTKNWRKWIKQYVYYRYTLNDQKWSFTTYRVSATRKNTISSKDPPLTAGVPQNTTPIKIYIIRKLFTYLVKAETLITFNNKFGAQSEREKSQKRRSYSHINFLYTKFFNFSRLNSWQTTHQHITKLETRKYTNKVHNRV